MPALNNFNAFVTVNGQKLIEFEDEDEDNQSPSVVTKYVEAVTGAEFKVEVLCELMDLPGCDGVQYSVFLDGKEMDKSIMEFRICRRGYSDGARSRSKGNWTIKKYTFADIVLTEQTSSSSQQDMKKLVDNLGTITLQIHRVRNIRPSYSENDWNVGRHLSSKSIPEKAVKGIAISHTTSLGAPQQFPNVGTVLCDKIDPQHDPYAVFKFKYRSQKALQDMCIIPRPSTPVPLEERPKNELTREELLELLNRQPVKEAKVETAAKIKFKRERDAEYDELMSSARTRKVARTEKKIEVIDLLD